MNCDEARLRLGEYLAATLPEPDRIAIKEHLHSCGNCREQVDEVLVRALRNLPMPPPAPGFRERAMGRPTRRLDGKARALAGMAVAAGLAMAIAGLLPGGKPDDVLQQVSLRVAEPETVNLLIEAPKALAEATFVMELPPGVELAGYEGQRQVAWRGSLKAGRNLLSLPVTARNATRGELVAHIRHGTGERSFRIRVEALPPAVSG